MGPFWGLCQFLNIPNIYHRAKNQKNDLQENDEGQADRQRWFYSTLRRTGVQKSVSRNKLLQTSMNMVVRTLKPLYKKRSKSSIN